MHEVWADRMPGFRTFFEFRLASLVPPMLPIAHVVKLGLRSVGQLNNEIYPVILSET